MICPFCNNEILDTSVFCGRCGKQIPRCPTCGYVIKENRPYCPIDGTAIPEEIRCSLSLPAESNKVKKKRNRFVIMAICAICLCVVILVVFAASRTGKIFTDKNEIEASEISIADTTDDTMNSETEDSSESRGSTTEAEREMEESESTAQEEDAMTQDEKIEYIRVVYYDTQDKLQSYKKTTANDMEYYFDGEVLKKIVAKAGTYDEDSYSNAGVYTAEYYYGDNGLLFVFVYGKGEEYRYYLEPAGGNQCIRYIGPDGVVKDFTEGVDAQETFKTTGYFCFLGYMEPHWAGIE
jgi:hypothetical protein